MPLGSLIMVIIIGYKLGMDWMAEEIELEGNKMGAKGYWNFCYKVTAPIGMAFILVGQIDSFFGLGIFS
jgi:NSS family neurotransmitter:Na+ symporter